MEFIKLGIELFSVSKKGHDTTNDKIFQMRMEKKKEYDYNKMSSE